MRKAIIAMSGGVYSSVAALLTKETGDECIGATMKLFHNEDIGVKREKTCCSLDDVEDARNVCYRMGIRYYVFNFSERFKEDVMDRFVDAYEHGATPNPCIDCNRYLKFDKMFQRMRELEYDYIVTGQWAKKAYTEAQKYGKANKIASSEDKTFSYIPDCSDLPISEDADYVYICENNTIYGTEIRKELDSPVQMVADMSSDILSRPVDVSKYAIIYGGAQKNLSMAGVTFVIVKEDALGKVSRQIPTMLDYRTHVEKGSMFNTPPVVPVFTALQTMKWIKAQGGVKVMDARAKERAEILYSEIDRNKLFRGTVAEEDRSLMNICFVMNDEYKELEALINRTLNKLPERRLRIFRMQRFEGKKYAEIASALSLSVKTVEAEMTKALQTLRKEIENYTQTV